MKAIIIANSKFVNSNELKKELASSDVIICADGGGKICYDFQIIPHLLMGDFDSLNEDIIDYFEMKGSKIIRFPAEKDFTDTEICIHKALELGCDTICIIAGVGGRIDHSLGNIWLLHYIAEHSARGYIVSDDNTIYLCRDRIELEGEVGDTISVFPLMGKVWGISTEGLKYPLKNSDIEFGIPIGVSNEMTCKKCVLSIDRGEILIIKQRI